MAMVLLVSGVERHLSGDSWGRSAHFFQKGLDVRRDDL